MLRVWKEPVGWCSAEDLRESRGKDNIGLKKMNRIVIMLWLTAGQWACGKTRSLVLTC